MLTYRIDRLLKRHDPPNLSLGSLGVLVLIHSWGFSDGTNNHRSNLHSPFSDSNILTIAIKAWDNQNPKSLGCYSIQDFFYRSDTMMLAQICEVYVKWVQNGFILEKIFSCAKLISKLVRNDRNKAKYLTLKWNIVLGNTVS